MDGRWSPALPKQSGSTGKTPSPNLKTLSSSTSADPRGIGYLYFGIFGSFCGAAEPAVAASACRTITTTPTTKSRIRSPWSPEFLGRCCAACPRPTSRASASAMPQNPAGAAEPNTQHLQMPDSSRQAPESSGSTSGKAVETEGLLHATYIRDPKPDRSEQPRAWRSRRRP